MLRKEGIDVTVGALSIIVLSVAAIMAQLGLRFLPEIATTLVGTSIVSAIMVGTALVSYRWAMLRGVSGQRILAVTMILIALTMAIMAANNGSGIFEMSIIALDTLGRLIMVAAIVTIFARLLGKGREFWRKLIINRD